MEHGTSRPARDGVVRIAGTDTFMVPGAHASVAGVVADDVVEAGWSWSV